MRIIFDLLGRTIHDEISEPARSTLIPGYDDIKDAALKSGAYGCSLSGSGPSIFAFAKSKASAERIGKAMQNEVKKNGMKVSLYVSKINNVGPKVIK